MLKRKTPLKAKKGFKRPTIEQMAESGLLQRGSTFKAKPKRLPVRKKREGPTQMDVFREIWAEREHVSEVSGTYLGDDMHPILMSHLLPKGSYLRFKLDKRNIVLMTPEEHEMWHREGPGNLMLYKGWDKVCDRYYDLLREANGVQ